MLRSFETPVQAFVMGASGGIGLELTRQLLASDRVGRVFAACRDPRDPRLASLLEAHRGRLAILQADLRSEASIEAAARDTRARTQHLDMVLNCAGLLHQGSIQPEKRLGTLDSAHFAEAMQINACGPLIVAKNLLDLIPRRGRSVIANLSARVGSIGDNRLGGWYSYRASKAALNMLTRTLALELSRSRPDCACVSFHPGTVATALSAPFRSRLPDSAVFSPRRAARQLLDQIDRLAPSDSGSFLSWDGNQIPW